MLVDNFDFVCLEVFFQFFEVLLGIVGELEMVCIYCNVEFFVELQFGWCGLYFLIGGDDLGCEKELVLFWVLYQCDGVWLFVDVVVCFGVDLE